MSRVDKPTIKDWLVVLGLVSVIVIVAVDIIVVRGRNKVLRDEIEKVSESAQIKVTYAEKKAAQQIARIEERIKFDEKKIADAKKQTIEVEDKYRERMKSVEESFQNKLKEQKEYCERQKESYERQIMDMRDDFNRRFRDYKEMMMSAGRAGDVSQRNSANGMQQGGESVQDATTPVKISRAERRQRYNRNLAEIKRLREAHPGCVIVPVQDQVRILETRFADSRQRRYCTKSQIIYVREQFHCTNCNLDFGIHNESGCCEVSRKRSFSEWSTRYREAEKAAQISARIDELLEENASLKKALW